MIHRWIGAGVVVLAATVLVCETSAQGLKYGGPTACSTDGCHGSAKPHREGRTIHNEYVHWLESKHAHSWENLATDRAKEVGAKMKLAAPPQESGRCLKCHSLLVPREQQQSTWDLTRGNACENCHGPSEKWRESHARGSAANWSHAKSLKAGMNDTQDLAVRGAICVKCHLAIDHEMLAAGHPFLSFELDNFSQRMPPHWIQEKPFVASKAWAAGQATALRASLRQLDLRVKAEAPVQFVGDAVAVANAYFTMLRLAGPKLAPSLWSPVEKELGWLSKGEVPEPEAIGRAAGEAFQKTLFDLARELGSRKYDAATNLALLKALTRAEADVEYGGFRTAEQLFFAIDSLYRPYEQQAKPASGARMKELIAKLQQGLSQPATGAWSADGFLTTLRDMASALGK